MPIFDVLLISNAPLRFRQALAVHELPLSEACDVGAGVQLAGVNRDVVNAVLRACKFRNLEWDGEGALYGLVREGPPGTSWDQDQSISRALFLSHFIHAHLGGFEFSARIETDDRGKLIRLEPADVSPAFARAYSCPGVQRLWLTQGEGSELKNLVQAYVEATTSLTNTHVGDAVSMFAESPFVFHGRPRVTLLAMALEGLVNRSPQRAVKQFTTRVPALASEVGLASLDKNWAERVYKLRSALAHGAPVLRADSNQERVSRVADLDAAMTDMDELLRRVLKRALLEGEFRDRLERIDEHWPVPGTGCPKCRAKDPELVPLQCPNCSARWNIAAAG